MQVAGTSGRVVVDGGEDDEGISTEAQGNAVLQALGLERRNEVRPHKVTAGCTQPRAYMVACMQLKTWVNTMSALDFHPR